MSSKKAFVNITNKYDRIVVLVDMDCFYCQVEEKLNPSLAGKPIAVVQYNTWQGGGIIAVNYAARAKGVTRHMRGDEAKQQCPDIELVRVPNVREKADLTKYREAGKEVAVVLQSFTTLLERASVDEAYLDITDNVLKRLEEMNQGSFQLKPSELINTYAVGYDSVGDYIQNISTRVDFNFDIECNDSDFPAVQKSDLKLLIGASIVSEIRAKVKEQTGYECSAGIAHNKILAKLACGLNKPNKQTILPLHQIKQLYNTLPVGKVRGLGGKFGEDVCERLGIRYIGDIQQFSESELQKKFDEKNGSWLYLISRGIDLEAVTPKFYSKSIGCCKKFPGRNCITDIDTLKYWLLELSKEICDRMEKDEIENNRKAKQMIVSYIQEINGNDVSSSRSLNQISNESEILAKYALELIKKNTDQFLKNIAENQNNEHLLNNSIKFLGISVGKFETIETKQNMLQKLFMNHAKKKNKVEEEEVIEENDSCKENTLKNMFMNNKLATATTRETVIKECDFSTLSTNENCKKNLGFKEEADKKSLKVEMNIDDNNVTSTMSKTKIKDGFFTVHFDKRRYDKEDNDNENNVNHGMNEHEMKSFFINAITTNSTIEEKNESIDKFDKKINKNNTLTTVGETKVLNNFSEESSSVNNFTNISEVISNDNLMNYIQEVSNDKQEAHNDPLPSTSKQFNENNSNTNITNDYTKTYAEFATPEITDNIYVDCEKCGKGILTYKLQTHLDYHYAFELSREQREKYREEIKLKIKSSSISSPPIKKLKTTENKIQNNKLIKNNIDRFLVKKCDLKNNKNNDKTFLNNSSSDDELTELCEECNVHISVTKLLEHQDFHTAKKLQFEINQSIKQQKETQSESSSFSKNELKSNNNKKTTKSVTKDNTNKNKSILAYFSS